ncbi:MAG: FAD:protein FMN transferase [Burkholderiales bacterium]|nr:FAD:protein FMN transferase [Burkholderiales bacterium]
MRLHRYEFRAMASSHEIVLGAGDALHAARTAEAMIADVQRIEAKYSRFRHGSLVSRINRAAGAAAVSMDAETAALLDYADTCHRASGGRFDITSGALSELWEFRRDPPRVPGADEIARALALVGWPSVERDHRSVRLPRAGMRIDLGGIGKEYAADRAAAIGIDGGIAHGCVNLGGDVRVWGGRPDGGPWRIGIRDPDGGRDPIATLDRFDGAVATSGDYERGFVVDGVRYGHVIDATDGRPVMHWRSVSVAAPLCVVAGSGATVAMLLGHDAPAWLAAQGCDWIGVDTSGAIHPRERRP